MNRPIPPQWALKKADEVLPPSLKTWRHRIAWALSETYDQGRRDGVASVQKLKQTWDSR